MKRNEHHQDNYPLFTVIMPVYEDSLSAKKLVSKIFELFQSKVKIILIDDGSISTTVLDAFNGDINVNLAVITLYKNIGHQAAIATGIAFSQSNELFLGDYLVIMDSDGEDPPCEIKNLLNVLILKGSGVAVAQRTKRNESASFKIFYSIYKIIFSFLTGRNINFGNFMALKICDVDRIIRVNTLWTHIAATIILSKIPRIHVPTKRGVRYFGHSKMNFVSLSLHGFKALSVFSEEVLVRVGVLCAILSCLSLLAVFGIIGLKLVNITTPGWASLTAGILFLILLQLGTITLMLLLNTRNKMNDIVYTPDCNSIVKNLWISNKPT